MHLLYIVCLHLLIYCFASFPICTSLKMFTVYWELSCADNENKFHEKFLFHNSYNLLSTYHVSGTALC